MKTNLKHRGVSLAASLLLAACAGTHPPAPAPGSIVPVMPSPPQGEPRGYDGIAAASLRGMLGSPAFIRKDGATEMWRYDSANCHAYVFVTGGVTAQRVDHVETLPRGTNGGADIACLNALKNGPKLP